MDDLNNSNINNNSSLRMNTTSSNLDKKYSKNDIIDKANRKLKESYDGMFIKRLNFLKSLLNEDSKNTVINMSKSG